MFWPTQYKPDGRYLVKRKLLPHGLAWLVFCPIRLHSLKYLYLGMFQKPANLLHISKTLQLCPPQVGFSQCMGPQTLDCFPFFFAVNHHNLKLFTCFHLQPLPRWKIYGGRNFAILSLHPQYPVSDMACRCPINLAWMNEWIMNINFTQDWKFSSEKETIMVFICGMDCLSTANL